MGETVVTVLNKGPKTTEVAIKLPLGLESHGKNAFTVVVSPLSFAIVQ